MEKSVLIIFVVFFVIGFLISIAMNVVNILNKGKKSDEEPRKWYWIKEKHPENGKKVELFRYNGDVEETVWYDSMFYENNFEFIYFWREVK